MRLIDADSIFPWYVQTFEFKPNEVHFSMLDILRNLDNIPTIEPWLHYWIPCSEKLPNGGGKYLVSAIDGRRHITTVAPYQPRSKTWGMMGRMSHWRVIAWMPLPEPYKGGEQND